MSTARRPRPTRPAILLPHPVRGAPCRSAAAAGLVLTLGLTGCSAAAPSGPGSSPPAETTTSASPSTPASEAGDPTATVHGLPADHEYPVTVAPSEPAWLPRDAEPGAISYRDAQGRRVVSIHALTSLAGVPERDVPPDVAAFLAERRPELVVSHVRGVRQNGAAAQRFRLAVRPGQAPSDLWAVARGSFKPLASSPMEVVSVRSSRGLVWLWTEWEPVSETEALARFDGGLAKVTVG